MIGRNRKRVIAVFFLAVLAVEDFYPAAAYALTSGPKQPEMAKFQPAGVSDMVDLFSGDFHYDIPLMDVGGYPLNLTYHSGTHIEDEASWVGVGWTVNPGSVNRTVRGLPDDFTGDNSGSDPQDAIQTIQHRKNFLKIGGQLDLNPQLFAWQTGSVSMHLGVYADNYYGIGADVGASVQFNMFQCANSSMTASLGLSSDTRQGVTVDPSMSLSTTYDGQKENNNVTLSGGFAYNTRQGLEDVKFGASYSFTDYTSTEKVSGSVGVLGFNKTFAHTYTPSFSTNTANSQGTFNFYLGPALWGGYGGVGGEGYVYQETNVEPHSTVPAYGYLNYVNGRKNPAALLDFNREKDGPFIQNAPAIPIPVSTEDYYEATSQAGSEEFRPFYNGNYIVYDRPFSNTSQSISGGFTLGAGNIFQAGAQLDYSSGQAITQPWTDNTNQYVTTVTPNVANIQAANPYYESVFFKKAGEQTKICPPYYNAIWQDNTQKVALSNSISGGAGTTPNFVSASGQVPIGGAITRNQREVRTSTFSYLTALQASQYGLDKMINGNPRVDPVNVANPVSTVHKPHHISEITVTDKDGTRKVYGIPVYNTDQEEVSMSVAGQTPGSSAFATARQTGLTSYTPGADNTESNGNGRENIYNRKIVPPYATSYLLTGILSPDYVDLTGNGITDDDLGTATKFHYSKSPVTYNWRAPYEQNMAQYNEGFLSDQTDDKGNYSFGTRELWYLDTIRSKTMIAVFYSSTRQDGLGVLGENGGQNSTNTLKELDSVRLFSTADWMKNGINAIPIKVAHFQYDYSLYPGVPNNLTAGQGKLTLKKLWFTFGSSTRGQTNPYIFAYDMRLIEDGSIANLPSDQLVTQEQTDQYYQQESDRWGTYKQSFYNRDYTKPSSNLGYMNNAEFPYSIQATDNGRYDERQLADRFASKWQLNSITTPTNGIISVQYESKDYAYVQDQQAMIMCPVSGVGSAGSSSGMIGTNMIYVTVPVAVSTATDFVNIYLSGPNGQNRDNFFYKVKTQVDGNSQHNEYVYGYAAIDYTQSIQSTSDNHTWGIPVKMVNGYNPISVEAWQMIQTDLPQYAYPNYDNSNVSGFAGNLAAAVESIVAAFVDFRELFESFDQIAAHGSYANTIDPTTSLIRLNYPVGLVNGPAGHHTYGKLGGGSRVNQIELNDNWNWNQQSGGKPVAYGIIYNYNTVDDKGDSVSSGVASYEPQIGNEENPFHQPVDYTEQIQWGLDRFHYMELPFGESYFPAPEVGYSQVTATTYGIDHSGTQGPVTNMGYTISQFYTARDFPTQVDYLPLEEDNYENDVTVLLFASRTVNRVATSQGFKVIDNDMHGKPKSVQTYDKGGTLIASKDYFYNVNDPNAQRKTLNNTVLAMNTDGTIPGPEMLIATDAELITDMRESNSSNMGYSAGANAGITFFTIPFPPLIVPIPYAGFNYEQSGAIRTYNSASTIKVIHQYGLLQEVKTTQNGSTLTADNLLWDAQTGDVLLTRNQNEFNDYTYALNYPAYRGYNGMSSAYENIGTIFSGFSTNTNGTLVNYGPSTATSGAPSYLAAGDELVDIDPGGMTHGWLMQSGDGTLRFIDQAGNFINIPAPGGTFMVVRSGRRNMLNAGAGSVVTMYNPLVAGGSGYTLQANVNANVLDSKAVTYKDEWGEPVPNFLSANTYGQIQVQPPTSCEPTTEGEAYFVSPGSSTCNPDYQIDSRNQAATCNANLFEADAIKEANETAQPLRSYLSFGTPTPAVVPSNAVITDVTLTLTAATDNPSTPSPTSGADNAAIIDRVTGANDCANTTWNLQPQFTNVGEAILAQSTTSAENYTVDVTNMYNDWATNTSIPLDLVIRLQNEGLPTNRLMVFDGAGGAHPPVLTFYYTIYGECTNPVNQPFNPYYAGVKGNWRPGYNYAYQVYRTENTGNPSQVGGTNIRTSGYYSSYTPFWMFTNGGLVPIAPAGGSAALPGAVSDPRWVWATQSVYYDQKGNEVEDVDALNRSSAVLFGYDQSLTTAVASNARHNEIAFEGFEDYYFNLLQTPTIPCPLTPEQLNMGFALQGSQYCSGGNCIVNTVSHTGNYSLQLGGTLSVSSPAGNTTAPTQFVGFDAAGHSILLANEQAGGFEPISGKQYLLSLWVNDGNPTSNLITGLQVSINGSAVNLSNMTVPVVEDWKLLNVTFTATSNFSLQLTGGGSIYIDDLRLMPFDAEMKTFVYDDQSLRLMGQLDENNFGVLYEYDEEGTPIRIKKETERGMMTVKENRQSLVPH